MTPRAPMWCDHCAADVRPAGIRACLRKVCETKAKLAERDRAPEPTSGRWRQWREEQLAKDQTP